MTPEPQTSRQRMNRLRLEAAQIIYDSYAGDRSVQIWARHAAARLRKEAKRIEQDGALDWPYTPRPVGSLRLLARAVVLTAASIAAAGALLYLAHLTGVIAS